jgi:hypothetical protein
MVACHAWTPRFLPAATAGREPLMSRNASRTPLSPYDIGHAGFSRTMLFAFRRCPDTQLLHETLGSLCRDVPDIAGAIKKGDDGEFYIERNCNEVPLTVRDLPNPMPHYGRDLLIDDNNVNVDVRAILEKPFDISGPLVKFDVSRFSCGGGVLAMELSHALADGVGRGLLLSRWARCCRNEADTGNVDVNRQKLIQLAEDYDDPIDEGELVEMTYAELTRRYDEVHRDPGMYAVIHVSSEAVDDLWSCCKAQIRGASYISRQDVLAAKIWKVMSIIQPDESKGHLYTVLDLRRSPHLGVSPSYLGNAVTGGAINYDLREVRNEPVATLACRIRTHSEEALAVKKVSRELYIAWRYRHLREQGIALVRTKDLETLEPDHVRGQLAINNFSRFPIQELDFGTGTPFWVGGVKQASWPSVGIFPLSDLDRRGYALHINLPQRPLEDLYNIVQNDSFFAVENDATGGHLPRCLCTWERH